jgi:hypothetical protein
VPNGPSPNGPTELGSPVAKVDTLKPSAMPVAFRIKLAFAGREKNDTTAADKTIPQCERRMVFPFGMNDSVTSPRPACCVPAVDRENHFIG